MPVDLDHVSKRVEVVEGSVDQLREKEHSRHEVLLLTIAAMKEELLREIHAIPEKVEKKCVLKDVYTAEQLALRKDVDNNATGVQGLDGRTTKMETRFARASAVVAAASAAIALFHDKIGALLDKVNL